MAGSVYIPAAGFLPFQTNGPQPLFRQGTNFGVDGYAFDAATKESVTVKFRLTGYTSGNITCEPDAYADTATTNNYIVGTQLAAITPGDAINMETKSLATQNLSAATAASGTSHGPTRPSTAISNLDSAADGDLIEIVFFRDAANGSDNMAGDLIVEGINFSWT